MERWVFQQDIATNIPPHNLGEVIDATIHRIDNPNCSLDTLMKYVKGPDFPTGGIVEGIKGIRVLMRLVRVELLLEVSMLLKGTL